MEQSFVRRLKKKIMLLGGSAQQTVAIKKAKEMGLDTVLCDYLPDNPGIQYTDIYYQESTVDKKTVLDIAKHEAVDGIIAYASDPAAPTAAFVAEKLGLPTNPYHAVNTLCNKNLFRNFLRNNGYNTPWFKCYDNVSNIMKQFENDDISYPLIVKPADSSGSKGVAITDSFSKVLSAAEAAFKYSRTHKIIVEDYIKREHPYLIGGDVFVLHGKIVQWGLMNCHRDYRGNKLVPVGKSYPPLLRDDQYQAVQSVLQSIVDKLKIRAGALNVELIISKDERVWPIDIGPRNGGNMIPDLLSFIFDTDVIEMTIKSAMGYEISYQEHNGIPFYAAYNLHCSSDGIYEDIYFDKMIERFIIKKSIYKQKGDAVHAFNNASDALGIIFMKFESEKEMHDILKQIEKHVSVVLKDG